MKLFFLALSNGNSSRVKTPVIGSIVAPDFFTGPRSLFTRTIEVSRYQPMPVFPGMLLEFMFDGIQWRLINLPFYYAFGLGGLGLSMCNG
jgi:hypothetical protein